MFVGSDREFYRVVVNYSVGDSQLFLVLDWLILENCCKIRSIHWLVTVRGAIFQLALLVSSFVLFLLLSSS